MIFITRFVFILMIISSCSFSDPENYRAARTLILGGERFSVTNSIYDAQQFSFAKVSIGRGNEVLMALKSINSDVFEWISEDGILIYTYQGIIVKTKGLDHDISFANYNSIDLSNSFFSIVNFLDPVLYEIPETFTLVSSGTKNINYLESDEEFNYVHFKRKIEILRLETHLEILFNDRGVPIMSEQKIHPNIGRIRMYFYYK